MEFKKYLQRGAYHWRQISRSPLSRNAFVVGRYQNMIELVRSHAGGCSGRQILDVGCGDGVLSWMFAEERAQVTGVDMLPLALDLAHRETVARDASIKFIEADGCSLPFEGGSFDVVVSSDTIEHAASPTDLLIEMKRVLKAGGWAVISTPVRLTWRPLDVMHVKEWFSEEFKNMVTKVMPQGEQFLSHPVFWMELATRHHFLRIGVNLLSLLWNPFRGLSPKFRYNALQYWVWRKP